MSQLQDSRVSEFHTAWDGVAARQGKAGLQEEGRKEACSQQP